MATLGKRIAIEESSSDESDGLNTGFGFEEKPVTNWKNKQRVLISCSRGVNSRVRHLISDLTGMLPHSKKEGKLAKNHITEQIESLSEMNSCNNLLFFEQKRTNSYLWMGKALDGPSAKFKLENVTTTKELKMVGNCLKFSRALLSFDASFEGDADKRLYKSLLIDTFGVPKNHPKSKPFMDHVFSFSWADNRIWFRHYQIHRDTKLEKSLQDAELVEIGPRFSLNPIKIFDGYLRGSVLYDNPFYVPPIQVRKNLLAQQAKQYLRKMEKKYKRQKVEETIIPTEGLEQIFEDELKEADLV